MAKEKVIYFTCYDNQLLRTVERDPNRRKARFGLECLCFFSCKLKDVQHEVSGFHGCNYEGQGNLVNFAVPRINEQSTETILIFKVQPYTNSKNNVLLI
jgi:hypothetical protein